MKHVASPAMPRVYSSLVTSDMNRRNLLRTGGAAFASTLLPATSLGSCTIYTAGSGKHPLTTDTRTVGTPSLHLTYEQTEPDSGQPIVLLHGFPYDVRQYDAVRNWPAR